MILAFDSYIHSAIEVVLHVAQRERNTQFNTLPNSVISKPFLADVVP